MVWSYMVFSNSSKEMEDKTENNQLWEKIVKLINEKVRKLNLRYIVTKLSNLKELCP